MIWFLRRKHLIAEFSELDASAGRRISGLERQLSELRALLLNQPRAARVLLLGEDTSGNSWAWGRTLTLSPGEKRAEVFQPQLPLKPGLLVGCFGDRVKLTDATAGYTVLTPFFGDGLFARAGAAIEIGTNVCVTVEADR